MNEMTNYTAHSDGDIGILIIQKATNIDITITPQVISTVTTILVTNVDNHKKLVTVLAILSLWSPILFFHHQHPQIVTNSYSPT